MQFVFVSAVLRVYMAGTNVPSVSWGFKQQLPCSWCSCLVGQCVECGAVFICCVNAQRMPRLIYDINTLKRVFGQPSDPVRHP